MDKKYQVLVDDNYHYTDESERRPVGSYDSFTRALEMCKQITIDSLKHLYEKGMTPDELHAQWLSFGEDPFIRGGDEPVPFSAREFIDDKLCEAVIDAISLVDHD